MSKNEDNGEELNLSTTVTSSPPVQIPQISEEKTEEVKYLLDNNQFLKFGSFTWREKE